MALIYLCDDEPRWLRRLEQIISDYPARNKEGFCVAFSAGSPTALLQHLKEHMPKGGIYVLDVMYEAEMNGMELGKNIRSLDMDAALIYVTNHEEMMRETFRLKLQVLDYILKNDKDLPDRIHQCLKHLEESRSLSCGASSRIVIQAGRSRRFLAKEEIYYINTEKGSHLLWIHTKNEVLTTYATLCSLEQQLKDIFLPCSRSTLVNPCHVISADHHTRKLLLDNGETCSCSTRMWSKILNQLDILQSL